MTASVTAFQFLLMLVPITSLYSRHIFYRYLVLPCQVLRGLCAAYLCLLLSLSHCLENCCNDLQMSDSFLSQDNLLSHYFISCLLLQIVLSPTRASYSLRVSRHCIPLLFAIAFIAHFSIFGMASTHYKLLSKLAGIIVIFIRVTA
jgi:hypothetical protein